MTTHARVRAAAFDRGDYPLNPEQRALWDGYVRGHVTLREYHARTRTLRNSQTLRTQQAEHAEPEPPRLPAGVEADLMAEWDRKRIDVYPDGTRAWPGSY